MANIHYTQLANLDLYLSQGDPHSCQQVCFDLPYDLTLYQTAKVELVLW